MGTDLEDANARLEAVARAIKKRDDAAEQVRRLTLELANAKRKQKEAGWELTLIISGERRAAKKGG